jgi:hypothetical protein
MTALTVARAPELRRLPVPVAEPRPALRVVPEQERASRAGQGVLTFANGGAETDERVPGDAAAHRVPPPAAAWARQFVQAALEAAAGRRPVSQLVRWTAEDVFALLTRRAALAARLERAGTGVTSQCSVRSVRLCRLSAAVVEASAVVVDRGRYRAVALRLEDSDGRWRVTALEIG